jgi:hypothetical protein
MCGTHARRDAVAAEPLPPSAFPEFEDLVNGWKSVALQPIPTPVGGL